MKTKLKTSDYIGYGLGCIYYLIWIALFAKIAHIIITSYLWIN